MDKDKIIQMTSEELEKHVSEVATKAAAEAAAKAAADTAEKVRQEFAQTQIPETMKSVSTEPLRIRIADSEHRLGTIIAAYGKSQMDRVHILDTFKAIGKEPSMYFNPDRVKNQLAGTFEDGGALIDEIYADEFIPLLKAKAVFRQAGISIKPMVNGQMTFRTGTQDSTAYWRGEAQKRTKSNKKYGQKRLITKYLDGVVVASDQSLRFATVDIAGDIERDLISKLALKEDWTIMYGLGTEYTPLGLFNAVAAANKNAMTCSGSAPTAAERKTDLVKCRKLLAAANVPEGRRIWVMHPTNRIDLETQVDANSNPMDYARALSETGKIQGAMVWDTTQAYNTDTSTYNTFYIDLDMVFIAQTMGISLKFAEGGAYIDGDGNTVVGQTTGESTFTCSLEEDIGIKYDSALAVITGTTWGS